MFSADLRLKTCFTAIIAGSSKSGKTAIVEQMMMNNEQCFTVPVSHVLWAHAKNAGDHAMFDKMKEKRPDISYEFIDEFPENRVRSGLFPSENKHSLLVIDDLFYSGKACESLFHIFNVSAHHEKFSVILIMQNLYANTQSQRACISSLLRSTEYLILMANRRQAPVYRQISQTFLPNEKWRLLNAYEYLRKQNIPHSYVVIEFEAEERLQVRIGGLIPTHPAYIIDEKMRKQNIRRRTTTEQTATAADQTYDARTKLNEKQILAKIQHQIDPNGYFIHTNGQSGSPIRMLIRYYLHADTEKPLDFKQFQENISDQ